MGVREDEDKPFTVLNLFNHKETDEVHEDDLKRTDGKRFETSSRWDAMQVLFKDWLQKR